MTRKRTLKPASAKGSPSNVELYATLLDLARAMGTVTAWRKASYSGGNGGNCVEVGHIAPAVAVRDTQDRDGVTLSVPAGTWAAFTASLG